MTFYHLHEREQALRWLFRNRRVDVSLEQAIRVMLLVLPRDMATVQSLQRIQREEEEKVKCEKPNRSRLPGFPPLR